MKKMAKVVAALALGAGILSVGGGAEAALSDQTIVTATVASDSGFANNGVKSVTWTTHFNPSWVHNDVTAVNNGAAFNRFIQLACGTPPVAVTVVNNVGGSSVLDDNYFLTCASSTVLSAGAATLTVTN